MPRGEEFGQFPISDAHKRSDHACRICANVLLVWKDVQRRTRFVLRALSVWLVQYRGTNRVTRESGNASWEDKIADQLPTESIHRTTSLTLHSTPLNVVAV